MDLSGAIAGLAALAKQAHGIAEGAAYEAIEAKLKKVARDLARDSWRRRESPSGKPWKQGTKPGRGDLYESGDMLRSLIVEDRLSGFAITDRVQAAGGAYYGGTHQYGRTIRAKGYDPVRAAAHWNGTRLKIGARWRPGAIRSGYGAMAQQGSLSLKMRAVRDAKGHYQYRAAPGAKPLIGGAMKVRIPSRAIVPKSGQLPPRWADAFRDEVNKWVQRYWGNYYTTGPDIRK